MRLMTVPISAIKGFVKDECFLKASALTYYTLFSIVPVLAVLFGIAHGFGIEDVLNSTLREVLSDHPEIAARMSEFIDSTLRHAKGSLIAGFGIILLIWSVILLFSTIETVFNSIWKTNSSRTFAAMLRDYPPIILFAPLFFAFISSFSIYIFNDMASYAKIIGFEHIPGGFETLWIQATTFALSWLFFTFLYIFIPAAHVKLAHGCLAGLIAAVLFYLLQQTFIAFQVNLTSYSALYGSFAALPLFLLWLQFSWWIVLLGAEIACHLQENEFLLNSEAEGEKIPAPLPALGALLLAESWKRFQKRSPPLSPEEFSRQFQLPSALSLQLFSMLARAKLLVKVTYERHEVQSCYQTACPLESVSMYNLIEALTPELMQEAAVLSGQDSRLFIQDWNTYFEELRERSISPKDHELNKTTEQSTN